MIDTDVQPQAESQFQLPELIRIDCRDELSWEDAFTSISLTPAGAFLGSQARFRDYKHPEVSNGAFINLLGPNISNLGHLAFTAEMMEGYLRSDGKHDYDSVDMLSHDEKKFLRIVAVMHDLGEAPHPELGYIGDISHHQKSKDGSNAKTQLEAAILEEISYEIIADSSSKFADVAKRRPSQSRKPDDLYRKLAQAIVLVDGDKSHELCPKLSIPFATIEHLGYMAAGLTAGQVSTDDISKLNDAGILRDRPGELSDDELITAQYKMIETMNYQVTSYWTGRIINEHVLGQDSFRAAAFMGMNLDDIHSAVESGSKLGHQADAFNPPARPLNDYSKIQRTLTANATKAEIKVNTYNDSKLDPSWMKV